MRVTQSMYYSNIYNNNNTKINKELFDVNKQISSGLKIQYAGDDVRTFAQTMSLDNELTTIGQIKKSTESGYKVSNQSDIIMNEFTTSMDRMRVLMVQAANGASSSTSLDAIAKELRGLEKHLKSLANTSINGQYLFSGSALDTKPIADDGTYQGNDVAMKAFVGSRNQEQYNITGSELFLGQEILTPREVTTNVVNKNLLDPVHSTLTTESKISELMGDKDETKSNVSHFYIRGTKSDGTSFKDRIDMNETSSIQNLLDGIETKFGDNLVNVSLNSSGEIVVSDKQKGSSKLDFHMVGAVDYNSDYASGTAVPADSAIVTDIDTLDSAETDYMSATSTSLFVKEFNKSGLTSATGAASNVEGLVYDRTQFVKDGATLSSNMPQVLKKTHLVEQGTLFVDTIKDDDENAFAKPSTLLSEVADTKKANGTNPETYTLDGTEFKLTGKDVSGNTFDATIDLSSSANGSSKFSIGGNDYHIYNVDGSKADADKVTYQQLMDVMNMVTTGTIPASDSAADYHTAIANAEKIGKTSLSYDGKIGFKDLTTTLTNASISMYDANSNDFSKDASVMTFNTNNSLTIRDPKTDFFKTIDTMITSVEDQKLYPDSSSGNARNVGIENSIAMMDDLQDHVFRTQSIVGAQSNSLTNAKERTSLIEISTMSLRSSVIDTDLAEASLKLSQLNLNYQAMLSTVGKVSQLSLVNYL